MKIGLVVYSLSSSEELKQNYAITIDVRFFIDTRGASILRVDVSNCAHDIGGGEILGYTQAFCDAKVS